MSGKIGYSFGAFEFRTRPSDFGPMGGKVRLMAERGETHLIHMDVAETMVTATPSYSKEMYRISCMVFGPVGVSVWDRDYKMRKPIASYDISLMSMRDMYNLVMNSKNASLSDYTAVKWWFVEMERTLHLEDFEEYAKRILSMSGRLDVPAWTFILKHERNSVVLYVRTFFLDTFKSGKDILNYVRMVNWAGIEGKIKNDMYNRVSKAKRVYGRV